MPLIYKTGIEDQITIGVWKFIEGPEFFKNELTLTANESLILSDMSEHRATEWLSSRYLTHLLSLREDRAPLQKDKYGKPYIADTAWHISISHSATMTAVIASDKVVGIDIQKQTKKIERIAYKFIKSEELDSFPEEQKQDYMHIFWSAKEAMYKAYGKKSLAFLKHIHIEPFKYGEEFTFEGHVIKEGQTMNFELFAKRIEDNYLVYAVEK